MSGASYVGDTFVISSDGSYILYVPSKGKITRLSQFPEKNSDLFVHLQSLGFFGDLPEALKKDNVDGWKGFRSLTLLMTRRCNLACIYCYAAAKADGRSMSPKLALRALDWFAGQFTGDTIRVSFHGGGEPTLEFELMQQVVAQARKIALKSGKKTHFEVVTNGTANLKIFDWLMDNDIRISISADGPPRIQDRNRPFQNGHGSSVVVERTISYLVGKKYPFTIRLTYSPVDEIEDIVRYFGNLGVKSLHLEPLFPHGRKYDEVAFGKESGDKVYSPQGNELVGIFLRAMDIAREYDMRINNSHLGHLAKGMGYFCGSASGRAMIVTDDGFISGCLEVVDAQDPDFETFHLGSFSEDSEEFIVDKTVLAKFQNRHSDQMVSCRNCFARYVCSGGCAVKAVRASKEFMDRDRPYCVFTKTLVPEIIKRIADLSGV